MTSTATGRQLGDTVASSRRLGQLMVSEAEGEVYDSKLPTIPHSAAKFPGIVYDSKSEPRCGQSCRQCASRCSQSCSQCYSCCSQGCSECRQRVRKKWQEFNNNLRWYSDIIWAGPFGAALNISNTIYKRAVIFMWGFNDENVPDRYWYPTFMRYALAVRLPLIIIGGSVGAYMVCCGGRKDYLRAFLRALPVGFSLTVIAEQDLFNEFFPDSKQLDDAIAYSTIYVVALGVSIGTARRYGRANKTPLTKCCAKSCKDRALFIWDNFTRALFYSSLLSIPIINIFDKHFYSTDGLDPEQKQEMRSLSFQRTWEWSAGIGIVASLMQSAILDPSTPDSPIVEIAGIGAYIYEVVTRLLDTEDPKQEAPEIVLWTILLVATFFTLHQARNLRHTTRRYSELPDDLDTSYRTNPFAGEDSSRYFGRGGGIFSSSAAPTPTEIRRAISPPVSVTLR